MYIVLEHDTDNNEATVWSKGYVSASAAVRAINEECIIYDEAKGPMLYAEREFSISCITFTIVEITLP